MYIKKFDQINEELKRKLTPSKIKQHAQEEEREKLEKNPADLFTDEEIRMLKHDDFEIDESGKEATSKDKFHTFVIKKSLGISDDVVFSLSITNNKNGEPVLDKKIKVTKRSQHKDTLDFLLDRCAYVDHIMKERALKELDPYGEESWTEEEKNKILGIEPAPKQTGKVIFTKKPKIEPKIVGNVKGPTGYVYQGKYHRWEEIPKGDEQLEDNIDEDENGDPIDECPACGGAGKMPLTGSVCYLCKGEGIVDIDTSEDWIKKRGEAKDWVEKEVPSIRKRVNPNPAVYDECTNCGGTGKEYDMDNCEFCQGTGYVAKGPKPKQKSVNPDWEDNRWWDDNPYRGGYKKEKELTVKEVEDFLNSLEPKTKNKLLDLFYPHELREMTMDKLIDMTAKIYGEVNFGKEKEESKWKPNDMVKYINPRSKWNNKIGEFQGERIKNGKKQYSVRFEDEEEERVVTVHFDEDEATLEPTNSKKAAKIKQSFRDNYELGNYYDNKAKAEKKKSRQGFVGSSEESKWKPDPNIVKAISDSKKKFEKAAEDQPKPKAGKGKEKEPDKVKELEDKLYSEDPKLKLYDEFIKKHGEPPEKEEKEIVKAAKEKVKKKESPKPKGTKEVECWNCRGWGRQEDGRPCPRCDGSGIITVDKDWRGANYSIGGASDYSYGS